MKDGDLAEARALLKSGADAEAKAWDPDPTALCWAAELGHVEISQALLEHGAKVNATHNRGSTPLKVLLGYNDFNSYEDRDATEKVLREWGGVECPHR